MAAEKEKGTKNQIIAASMNVTVRYVQKLWARFKHTPEGNIVFPARMGRPPRGPPTRAERSAVLNMRCALKSGANRIWGRIRRSGTPVPKGVVHMILREYGEAVEHKRKQARRKWIRYERKHSNSMWHTDYKRLDDGRWFISYQDDASRLIVWWGVFDEATGKHAVKVLEEAMPKHGKPESILSDRGAQFYATESEKKAKGVSMFEKRLSDLSIRHILASVAHPRTNGKLERARGRCGAISACSMTWPGRRACVPSTRRASRRIPWRGSSNGTTASGRTCRWTRTLRKRPKWRLGARLPLRGRTQPMNDRRPDLREIYSREGSTL